MKALFVTMAWPLKGQSNMYSDLISEFIEQKQIIDVLALSEKRNRITTHIEKEENLQVAFVKCGNIQKVNKYKKVINSFFAGFAMLHVAKKYYSNNKYDTIIFALPPLTISPFLILMKKSYKTKLYLLLKEFWPQDPVDLGAMTQGGIVWRIFRLLEIKLYYNSDYIGTMSQAGITYLKNNNPHLPKTLILEECPNCQKVIFADSIDKISLRKKYSLPRNKTIFVFGGNFGVSQGIDEMIAEIKSVKNFPDIFFLLLGDGTEFERVRAELGCLSKQFIRIISSVPRTEFDEILHACDVGLIFLFPQYTVPNIPSRMISYLSASLPILAAVDHTSDAGDIIVNAGCGIKLFNGDIEAFKRAVLFFTSSDTRNKMSENSRQLMLTQYSAEKCCKIILRHFN